MPLKASQALTGRMYAFCYSSINLNAEKQIMICCVVKLPTHSIYASDL